MRSELQKIKAIKLNKKNLLNVDGFVCELVHHGSIFLPDRDEVKLAIKICEGYLKYYSQEEIDAYNKKEEDYIRNYRGRGAK